METEVKRAPAIPCGWSSNATASLAAARAFAKGKTEEECFQAAKEAVLDEVEQAAEEVEQDIKQLDSVLQHEYFQAICNTVRADSLGFDDARKAAAVLSVPTVTFSEWRKRLNV